MRGDVLFFRPDRKNIFGRLIAHFTKGPFNHVEIDLGDNTMLGAQLNGVAIRPKQTPDVAFVMPPVCFVDHGIDWAKKNVGKKYGFVGILSNVMKLFGSPVFIGDSGTYTCSELVCHYLDEAGMDMGDLALEYDVASPNDIARLLYLID